MTSIRTLELHGTDPTGWGEQHGEAFRDDIRQIAAIRMELTLGRTDLGTRENVLALASHHLPVLARFDQDLHDELVGIARGAGLTPEEIVVTNHYTDLRDLSLRDLLHLRAPASAAARADSHKDPHEDPRKDPREDPGGCTALFARPGAARLLGQTWDMHGSAEPYAVLLSYPAQPDGALVDKVSAAGIPKRGRTVVFSITGCLGMTGMSSWGVALTINNLNSMDATLGVVWPALVRKALRQPSAVAMRDLILGSPIGSGRHYIVADSTHVFGIETSGTKKKIIFENGAGPYFHTNHCVDDEMKGTCKILPGSTTVQRYATMGETLKAGVPQDLRGAFDAFAPVGLKHNPKNAHDVATCGALVMDITARNVMACVGIPGPDADSIVVEVR